MTNHLDAGIQRVDRLLRGFCLRRADAVGRVNYLPLKIRHIDHVEIHQPERADPRRRQVQRRRRSERARAEQKHLGVEQLRLSLLADFGDNEMARVAGQLVGGERAIRDPRQPAILPRAEAARHVVHVLVAELAQRARRQQRARARRALQNHRRLVVRNLLFDSKLEESARNRDRLRNMPLPPFVALAHVDQHGTGLIDHPARFVDSDLLNRRACFVENILGSFRHKFSRPDPSADSVSIYNYNHERESRRAAARHPPIIRCDSTSVRRKLSTCAACPRGVTS